jgi:hypothetical protein
LTDVLFRAHTDGVIAALVDAGLAVGDHEAPDDAGRQTDGSFDKYVVVYRIPGGSRSGNLDDPYGDAEFIYQVTSVGSSRKEVEWLCDKVDPAMLAGVSVDGRSIEVVPHGNPGIPRDDDESPPIWSAASRYRLISTPS